MDPSFLLGRRVSVKWDSGWFTGSVARWDADTQQHAVEYDDGDKELLHIGLEPAAVAVRVQLQQDETLPPAPPEELARLAQLLLQRAAEDDSAASRATGPAARRLHEKQGADY